MDKRTYFFKSEFAFFRNKTTADVTSQEVFGVKIISLNSIILSVLQKITLVYSIYRPELYKSDNNNKISRTVRGVKYCQIMEKHVRIDPVHEMQDSFWKCRRAKLNIRSEKHISINLLEKMFYMFRSSITENNSTKYFKKSTNLYVSINF